MVVVNNSLQLPPEIPVAFALPFQFKLTLLFALFFQFSLLLLTRIGLVPSKHLLEPVADGICPSFMPSSICPKITPRNPRQALFGV